MHAHTSMLATRLVCLCVHAALMTALCQPFPLGAHLPLPSSAWEVKEVPSPLSLVVAVLVAVTVLVEGVVAVVVAVAAVVVVVLLDYLV